jgi:hypothetical protein
MDRWKAIAVRRGMDALDAACTLLVTEPVSLERREAVDRVYADLLVQAGVSPEDMQRRRGAVEVVKGAATARKVQQCASDLRMAPIEDFDDNLKSFDIYWDEFKKQFPAPTS